VENYERLCDVLSEQLDSYRRIVRTLQDQQNAIKGNDLAGLGSAIAAQESILADIYTGEQDRRRAQAELAGAQGLDPGDCGWEELVGAAPEEVRERLEDLRDDLLAEVQRTQELNRTNRGLIANALGIVDYVLNLLTGDGTGKVAYQAMGSRPGRFGAAVLDRRA